MHAMLKTRFAAAIVIVAGSSANVFAQNYPERPVRFIIALAAGGSADIVGRLLAQKLGESFGQQFVVDNRPGAAGIIAAEIAAKAPRDGYTLLLVGSSFVVAPSLNRKLPYDPLKDLAAITMAATAPGLLVINPALPVRTVKELIELARAKPGQLNFGSPGNGTAPHFAGALFNMMAGIDMVHVPYKGAAMVMIDLIAGQIQMSFASMPSAIAHAKSGKLRGIAVTGAKRSAAMPELPTVAESGLPGFESGAWQGLFAPAGISNAIIGRLNREIARIVHLPEVVIQLAKDGAEPVGNTAQEFSQWLPGELAKWAKVAKAAHMHVE
ncbi:MAG TPA: tripartite tricarboxylate transporter substrate binding protein [Burkholderiales bacterium]|nr:tripartite tricarboxylate transporter substrate binding protein [Burkholderiales bacterium]